MIEAEILLVEDNPADAELTIRALDKKNLGDNLHWVRDGEEALEYLFSRDDFEGEETGKLPKLIMIDLRMPKVDGLDVLREIRSNENTRLIPVVVLTSSTEDRDMVESYKLGANSYVSKPTEFDEFLRTISTIGVYWMSINRVPSDS